MLHSIWHLFLRKQNPQSYQQSLDPALFETEFAQAALVTIENGSSESI